MNDFMDTTTDKQGLYAPEHEHDACGIGFVVDMKQRQTHELVEQSLTMLENMEHRGGCGCDSNSGDGAGLMTAIPKEFFRKEGIKYGIEVPEEGDYGVGMIFFPSRQSDRILVRNLIIRRVHQMGFTMLGFRRVPVNKEILNENERKTLPMIEQLFLTHSKIKKQDQLERRLYILRKAMEHDIRTQLPELKEDFYVPSLSCRKIIYKGQLTTTQLRNFYPDLNNRHYASHFTLIHSRFSTNTFAKWKLAQPFRMLAHNGEINTIKGNVNHMTSSQTMLESTLFTREEVRMLLPICEHENSDSANFDSMLELLIMGGRSLSHAMMILIPEAWQQDEFMQDDKKAFYQFHSSIMKPWDGPAAMVFTNGKEIGATLDRNGLRPLRYMTTSDDLFIGASEMGAFHVEPKKVIQKGRLKSGRMILIDMEKGEWIQDKDIKKQVVTEHPYRKWLELNDVPIESLPQHEVSGKPKTSMQFKQQLLTFGVTQETINRIVIPMSTDGKEPTGSMGADTPLPVLSLHAQHFSNYFKQLFAQVSNPPIDPIRERIVMSLRTTIGRTYNILSTSPTQSKRVSMEQPILTNPELEKIKNIEHTNFRSEVIHAVFKANGKPGTLEKSLEVLCKQADKAIIDRQANILIISDRKANSEFAPIPALMAVGTIHNYLIRKGTRVRAGIVVECGDAVESHHLATLVGFGANAVNPYTALDIIENLYKSGQLDTESVEKATDNYINAMGGGLLKIFSKMGISTLQSYHGAGIFEAVGLGREIIKKCFPHTASRIGGLGFDDIAREALIKHRAGYQNEHWDKQILPVGGVYQWKRRGEAHLFDPKTLHMLQQSVWTNDYELYKTYAKRIDERMAGDLLTLRGMLGFKNRKSIDINEVEPVEDILTRFNSGAMSFGSLSYEAHSTISVAMNRIGARSNSGEGGEDEKRFVHNSNGDLENSATKQIASGRFGVTSHYLTNATELQIKVAQGAKPGEGGQLPGFKVDVEIGRVRNSTPGVTLISPPPHHDIYSIEDLAQLIFDLKNSNPQARINVKLTSEIGVGTIAVGVAKGFSDAIMISGADGGTGASPLSSIMHAGLPWELGLSEAHQTLVKSQMRDRVRLQVDGQIRTARDIAIATLLGAEEWGVATALLIAEGCIMMRKCHLNTCPVGVATQDPQLRALFKGKPEYIVNFLTFLAQELREYMAELGFRTINEMVGQTQKLEKADFTKANWKTKNINFDSILHKPKTKQTLYKSIEQQHAIDTVLDRQIIYKCTPTLQTGKPISSSFTIHNTDRSVGAMISYEVSKKYGSAGLPKGTIQVGFRGSAGQSFGVFLTKGIAFDLEGEANDYFGKGLSGGSLTLKPDRESTFTAEDNIILGNVAFYGATGGEAYINGLAGERFCVRNSGAHVVVEGVGDHACEYMTGGRAIILGDTGRNFGAGMSGGIAYVWNKLGTFHRKCNTEMVELEAPTSEDESYLLQQIQNHVDATGSQLGKAMLADWIAYKHKMIKVMPQDYKRVLEQENREDNQQKYA